MKKAKSARKAATAKAAAKTAAKAAPPRKPKTAATSAARPPAAASAPDARPQFAPGAKAPAFTLADADGRPVRLADFAGKWLVLYFYPRADTPGCTKEACEFTEGIAAFRGMGAEVAGVSPDRSPALARFRAKYGLAVRLLGDPERTTLAKYGAWGVKKMYGRDVTGVIRSTVLIDPSGRVARHWKQVRAAGHAEQVKAALAELRGAE